MKMIAIIIGIVILGYLLIGFLVGYVVMHSLGGRPTFWKLLEFAIRWPWFL